MKKHIDSFMSTCQNHKRLNVLFLFSLLYTTCRTSHASACFAISMHSLHLQVTHAGPPVPYRATFQAAPSSSKPVYSWRSRLQSLICCFGVPNQGYVRENANSGGAGPVARIQQPPIPPKLGREMESLIGPIRVEDAHKKTLVLDLDETLVHSSFKPIPSASVSGHAFCLVSALDA